jgi:glutamine synthetase
MGLDVETLNHHPHPEATRIEHRVPGADANPYIAVAATLAGGLHGIAEKIEPPPAFEGDAYSGSAGLVPLPATLDEALDALEASDLARELLGAGFIEHFLRVKRHEASVARAQVTDWEVRRYLELA